MTAPVETATTTPRISPLAIPLLGVMAGIQSADPTIASTALVEASRSLGMSGGLQALAASISTLMLAATVISTGLLADRIRRRRLLIAALLLTVVGSALVVVSPAPTLYLIGRALAGIGLGAVFGASFAYIRAVVQPGALAAAMGTFAAVTAVTTIVASFAGGTVASLNWRFAFLIVPILSLLCVLAVPRVLPVEPPQGKGPQDILGQVLLAFGVIGVLYGVSHAGSGITEPLTWVPFLGGIVLLVLFAVRERRSPTPFFPIALFAHPGFLAAAAIGFAFNFAQAAAVLQFANLWQFVDGFSTFQVSLGQLPLTIVSIVAAVTVGRMIARGLSEGTAAVVGGFAITVGFLSLLLVLVSQSYWVFLPALVLIGAGASAMTVPYGSMIVRLAPDKYFGPVTSSRTTIGQVGYAIGLSGATVLIDALTDGGVIKRLRDAGVPPSRTGQGLDAVQVYASLGTDPTTALGQQALASAAGSYRESFVTTMVVAAVIVGALSLAAGLLYNRWMRIGAADASAGSPAAGSPEPTAAASASSSAAAPTTRRHARHQPTGSHRPSK